MTGTSWIPRVRMMPSARDSWASCGRVIGFAVISSRATGQVTTISAPRGERAAFSVSFAESWPSRQVAGHLVAVLPVGIVAAEEVGDREFEVGVEPDGGRVAHPPLQRHPPEPSPPAPFQPRRPQALADAAAADAPG